MFFFACDLSPPRYYQKQTTNTRVVLSFAFWVFWTVWLPVLARACDALRTRRINGRGRFKFGFEWRETEDRRMFTCFGDEEMAANASLSGQSHVDSTSLNDQSVFNRSHNRSLRVAEKERRKNEAEDPFVLAWKYFSDGQSRRCLISTEQYCSSSVQASKALSYVIVV